MTANIKCFIDKECTKEIGLSDIGTYLVQLGPLEGLNGHSGEYWEAPIYFKNVGTRAALNVTLSIENDPLEYIALDPMNVGDFKELEVKPVIVSATIPRWTPYAIETPRFIIEYFTLPEIDEVFHNPYQAEREVAE